ncbi:armadillo repeat-containing protein 10 [Rhineura floridana]|uniref:armadillo repeat-containing protein 10 n=1 Tax=Rhineura floridana TaxID=261503 RepID=UPI002AC80EAF|nr:armadillo repeat-containing protein 10 [Rhineura floridana]
MSIAPQGGGEALLPTTAVLPGHREEAPTYSLPVTRQHHSMVLRVVNGRFPLALPPPIVRFQNNEDRRKFFLSDMRDSRGSVMIRTGLVGLAVGAGVCYCIYRVTSRRSKNHGAAAETKEGNVQEERESSPTSVSCGARQMAAPESSLLQQVSGIPVISSMVRDDSASLQQGMDLSKSAHGLEAHHIQNLINLLESTKDPSIQEQVLITLSNSAAFSNNQDIIRNLGGLAVVGKMLSVPVTKVKEKALNALNNLSMNIKNQEEIKIHISKVCEEMDSSPLNSELQLAALRFVTNMSVTNYYHYMMIHSIPCLLHLLLEGNERIQVQVLKVLVNLSANPAMTEHLLNAQAPFLLSLFDSCINKEVLLRVLVFATNLTKHMQRDKNIMVHHHSEDSIFSVLWGNPTECAHKLASLLYHHDTEVKEQVAQLIMQQC